MCYKKDLDYVTKTVLSTDKNNEEKFVKMAKDNPKEAEKFMKDFRSVIEETLDELFRVAGKETPTIIRGLYFLQAKILNNPTISYSLVSMIRWFCYFDYYREVAENILTTKKIEKDSFLYNVVMSTEGISITENSLEVGTTSALSYLTSTGTFKCYDIPDFDRFNSLFTEKEKNIMYMLIHYILTQGTNVMDLISPNFTERYNAGKVDNEEAKNLYKKCVELFEDKNLLLSITEPIIPIDIVTRHAAVNRTTITPRNTAALKRIGLFKEEAV